MKVIRSIYFLFIARLREFYRDQASLLWNIAFPFMLIGGFYFIFKKSPEPIYKIGIINELTHNQLNKLKHTQFVKYDDENLAIEKIRKHKIDLLVKENEASIHYWVNSDSQKAYFIESLFLAQSLKPMIKNEIKGRKISYLEWVFPGILCMNLMFSCLWGVGYVIVKYRQDGYLKRLNATPISAFQFLAGQLLARLVVSFMVALIVLFGGMWLLKTQVYGSYINLILLFLFGTMSLVSMGLIVATRTTSKEFADGILNFLSWPMMFFSEVWFSLESSSPTVQWVSQTMPLTHLIQGVRKVMIEGKGFSEISHHIIYMGAFTLALMLISTFLFKWSER